MIYANLADRSQLPGKETSVGRALAAALDFISSAKPADLETGRYELGEGAFALVQRYDTAHATSKRYELHRKYIDVQALIEGSEIIYACPSLGPKSETGNYDAEKDISFFDLAFGQALPLLLRPGTFTILFTEEPHKPGCAVKEAAGVVKVVVKIPV